MRRLGADALIRRYDLDDLPFKGLHGSTEGSFTICSFWHIECLALISAAYAINLKLDKNTAKAWRF